MIVRIGIPNKDQGGKILGYNYIDLTAQKTTDNAAYQDAYNEYEYAQYEYDKKQEEINAKTEIIQQQDRNLELKLQRLDTERQQVTAEIDALKTVIKDNVDKSFKTFSG
jgi:predicted  nucleic acid-binding Zn-ribbon protein